MFSRLVISGILIVVLVVLLTCSVNSRRLYSKEMGKPVSMLNIALMLPIIGNIAIIFSENENLAMVGYYVYFIGMDFALVEVMKFSEAYCASARENKPAQKKIIAVYSVILGLDIVQLLVSIVTKHAFTLVEKNSEGTICYSARPLIGLLIHRVNVFAVFVSLIIVFSIATAKTSRLYREKYSIILSILIVVGAVETVCLIADDPINLSMLGFGVFGVAAYYFGLEYRPLRLLDRMLSEIISNSSDACFIFSPRGRCIWVNQAGCLMAGVQENNCENARELLEYLFNTELRMANWTEQHITGGGDSLKYYRLENHYVTNGKGKITGYYLKISDITEEQLKLRKDLFEATHDKLTGLYTKDHMYKLIKQNLVAHKNTRYVILYINIKSFKMVKDIFGNEFGDYAVRNYADKKKSLFSDKCVYGRIGVADFGVLMPKEEFEDMDIDNDLSRLTIKKGKARYPIQAQIGVYEVDNDDTDVDVMFTNARIALSAIENDETAVVAFYDENLRNEILWNQEIASQLSDAIKNREIRPYLQPIADRDGRIVGCEALVRWIYKDQGVLAPYKFIPSLEKNGMIAEVDKYMWRSACEILSGWQKRGWDTFISVNISPKDFYYIDVPKYLKSLVDEFGINPKYLRVEITETVMVNDTDKAIAIMRELRDYGFIVEMDDFGSGYSSLNMLKSMPVDVLKIDMKFLGKSDDAKRADTIVKNVINLSMELGITSLTEGVETQNQYNSLSDMGCKLFQGYYFSKPIPTEQFEELIIEKN